MKNDIKRLYSLPLKVTGILALAVILSVLFGASSGANVAAMSLAEGGAWSAEAISHPLALSAQHEVVVTYTYDAAGHLAQASYDEEYDIAYRYDAVGDLLQREMTGAVHPVYLPAILR
ncbi:MAG: hypothetical protein J7M34_13360 [Anaerolineae bacterium]|nr:hypothetical protein [Anaerolineae bacterium]